MPISRREFILRMTCALAAGAANTGCNRDTSPDKLQGSDSVSEDDRPIVDGTEDPAALPRPAQLSNPKDWDEVRSQFVLSDDFIHMGALYISSHPRAVRDAIDRYRMELDLDPVSYLNQQNRYRINDALSAAASYLGAPDPSDIALTDSTTMGIGLVYNGLQLPRDSEVLSTTRDYYVTHEALRIAALRNQISLRQIPLYENIHRASEDSITDAVTEAIQPRTRILALTWVHSGSGLKLPLERIAAAVRQINAKRDVHDQILICVDGVHGFGVENATMADLGCDFFMAGCHKWLFGPRGTGLVWGSVRGWESMLPTIPSFYDNNARGAWMNGTDISTRTNGHSMSPGGFKAFEHVWALPEAFALHQEIGKARVAQRTHELARQLKEGLRKMKHVTLQTPMADNLSSGIVCFEVDKISPSATVRRLRERRIIATVTPYSTRYARLAPSIRNSPEEVEAVLREVRALR